MPSAADILATITKAKGDSPAPAWLRASAEYDRYTLPDGAHADRQEALYQTLSWIQIAVSTLARTAAATTLSVKQRSGEEQRDIPNHPFEVQLTRPNPMQSRFEFLESTFAYRALTGNAYWWLNRTSETAPPGELWVIPSHRIQPIPDGKQFIRGYVYDVGDGSKMLLEPHEVVHFKAFHPRNAYVGLSPIEALSVVATGDLAMQRYNTNYFHKDNAKMPGALAWSDYVNDTDWERIKSQLREEHGGTKRSMMLLRGAGPGGVQWLNMALSQKDMEFLSGRTFTKEEIFATFAPGLSSVLAVNATEANAVAGKATFVEFAVWPALVAVAEKITNDVLPSYGENLVAVFDDIRHSDTALELQKQAAYERTHTINEVRKEFYGDEAVEDERGNLFPSEIGVGLTDARAPEDKPEPVPPAAPPPPAMDAAEEDESDAAEDLARFQRKALKALKAGRSAAVPFESEALSSQVVADLTAALAGARSVEEVKSIFALPFWL